MTLSASSPMVRVAVVALVLLSAVGLAMRFGLPSAILLLAASLLLLVVLFAFQSMVALTGPPNPEDLLRQAPKTHAESRKDAAMKAIADLEFERSIGNVSDDDYAMLNDRYRTEAKGALRALDEERKARRERAEALAGLSPDELKALDKPTSGKAASGLRRCPACATTNDSDARFCKSCAVALNTKAIVQEEP